MNLDPIILEKRWIDGESWPNDFIEKMNRGEDLKCKWVGSRCPLTRVLIWWKRHRDWAIESKDINSWRIGQTQENIGFVWLYLKKTKQNKTKQKQKSSLRQHMCLRIYYAIRNKIGNQTIFVRNKTIPSKAREPAALSIYAPLRR